MDRTWWLTCLLVTSMRLAAQPPAIAQNGVVNQASQIAPTLPGGSLARGVLVEIRGVRLALADGKATVMLVHGTARIPVTVLSASERKIESRIPADAPLGAATLAVTVGERSSQPFPVQIVASNPGIYSGNGEGWGPGSIDNLDTELRRSANSRTNPAKPGQRVVAVATGLTPGVSASVSLGGRLTLASVKSRGLGKEELLFTIPVDTPAGCNVPLYVLAAPKRASNVVTLAISRNGACPDPFISSFGPAHVLLAVFSRSVMRSGEGQPDSIYDEAVLSFAGVGRDFRPSPLLLLPPLGTCTAYSGSFQTATMLPDSASAALVSQMSGRGLDVGPVLTVSRNGADRTIPGNPSSPGFFRARLGGSATRFGPRALAPFLDSGEYRFTVPGGRDVGAIALSFAGPSPLEWTNRAETDGIDRERGARIEWRGAASSQRVIILATSVDQLSTATGTVLCSALAGAGHLNISPEILANLPASSGTAEALYNRLFVGTLPFQIEHVRAPGLDDGAVISLYATGRFVDYR